MSKRLIKLLPLAAALALSGYASATTPKELPSVVVKYGDLDLDTKAGVKSLHSRLRFAAEQVCSPLDSRVLGLRDQYDRCVTDAVTQSVAAVGNPDLIMFHRYGGRFGLVASS
jgi:UrcA family protein